MKKIALINDLSGFGKCSLTAAIPVVSVMGIQACPLPTAVLSSQTGFASYFCDDYTDKMDKFTNEWAKLGVKFNGIHSGYLASPKQINNVAHFLDTFQTTDTIYLCDPVMGDSGHKYSMFTQTLLEGMRGLCKRATICTPNLTELCLLANTNYNLLIVHSHEDKYLDYITDICKKFLASSMRPISTILVTGIIRDKKERQFVGNLAVTKNNNCFDVNYLETPYTGLSFSGTGDLLAAVICSSLVNGLSVKDAVQKSIDFLQPAIEDATKENVERNHGVHFEKYLSKLI